MEAQATTGVAKSEGEEKQTAFEENAARAAAIQQEIAEAAAQGDFAKIGELSAEGQRLKSTNENVVAEDHQEGLEMNAEMDAEKSRQEAEAAKIAAEAATEQARFAQEAAEKAAADQAAAEKLTEEIKGGKTISTVAMAEGGAQKVSEEEKNLPREKRDPAYAVERVYEGGYVTTDDVKALFEKKGFTPEQQKAVLIDGIVAKLTVGRSNPVGEINYIMNEFGLTKEDLANTKVQDIAIEKLDKGVEEALKAGLNRVDPALEERIRAVLPDTIVDSRMSGYFEKTQ